MSSTIVNKGNVSINYTTAPTGTLDLSCYTTALEITPSTEEIDVGTYCAPSLTDQGRTTFSAVLALLWEPGLYDAIAPYLGREGNLISYPGTVTGVPPIPPGTPYIKFKTRIIVQPWGRFEIGQRVEVEIPLPVLDLPVMLLST